MEKEKNTYTWAREALPLEPFPETLAIHTHCPIPSFRTLVRVVAQGTIV
jgi:hypothetical protein